MEKIVFFGVKVFQHAPSLAVIGAAGYAMKQLYMHSFGAASLQKRLSYYPDNDHPFDDQTEKLLDELKDHFLLKLGVKDVAKMQFFWSSQPMILHFGSTKTKSGTYIGIPVHYKYKDAAEVDTGPYQVSNLQSSQNEKLMQHLKDSLVLSDAAKKFAIASEIYAADSYHVYFKFMVFFFIYCSYSFTYAFRNIISKMSLVRQSLLLIGIIATCIVLYVQSENFYMHMRRNGADKQTSSISREYLEGGIEYIAKLVECNKALRELNVKGHSMYMENGDEIEKILRVSNPKLSTRMKHLQILNKKLYQADATEAVSTGEV